MFRFASPICLHRLHFAFVASYTSPTSTFTRALFSAKKYHSATCFTLILFRFIPPSSELFHHILFSLTYSDKNLLLTMRNGCVIQLLNDETLGRRSKPPDQELAQNGSSVPTRPALTSLYTDTYLWRDSFDYGTKPKLMINQIPALDLPLTHLPEAELIQGSTVTRFCPSLRRFSISPTTITQRHLHHVSRPSPTIVPKFLVSLKRSSR